MKKTDFPFFLSNCVCFGAEMMLRRVNTSVLSTSSSPCCVVLGGRTTHPTQQQQQQQRRLLMVQSSCCMLACPCPSHMPRCSHLVRVGGAVKPLPSTTLSPAINSTRLLNYAKLSLMQSSASLYSSSTATNATNATATATASTEEQAQSFSSLQLSEPIQRALQVVFKYSTMSDVQAAVLDPQLQQTDLLVKAKTGTGKTLAFLISAIERLANGDPDEVKKKKKKNGPHLFYLFLTYCSFPF